MRGSRGTRRRTGAILLSMGATLAGPGAWAQEPAANPRPTFNLYGVTGLIDTPSAETQTDGQLSLTSSYFGGFMRNTLHFQVLPRIEGTFRYSIIEEFASDRSTLYDRSFDLKFRFSDETRAFPSIAVGLQDMFGTGVYSSEYIVGTKHITPDLKVSGGIGWGRFSEMNGFNNPLGWFATGARDRDRLTGDATGQVRFGQFFRGEEAALFGGVEWRTPVEGLSLKAEYSSDRYSRERKFGDFKQEVPFNFGVEYRPYSWIELGVYAMYGTDFGLRATLTGNPDQPLSPPDLDSGPMPVVPRARLESPASERFGPVREMIDEAPAPPPPASVTAVSLDDSPTGPRWATARTSGYDCPADAARAIDAEYGLVDGVTFLSPGGAAICSVVLRPDGRRYLAEARRGDPGAAPRRDVSWHDDPARREAALDRLIAAFGEEGLELLAVGLEPERVHVEIRNIRYLHAAQAVGRAARSLAASMPASVETFDVTLVEAGLPTVTVRMRRSLLEDQAEQPDAARRSWLTAELRDAAPTQDSDAAEMPDLFPRFRWELNPSTPISMFDPDQPIRADLKAEAIGAVELSRGLSVNARVSKRVIGDLDQITRESDSTLPRVRSDVARYLRDGDPAMERLTADFLFKPLPDLFGRLSAGYFESMYGGLSAELLWKPVDQRWGLGAEINYVKQRDFDQLLGFRDYEIATGHASLYWQTGVFGLEAQVDAGRYLAGDWGGTFTLTRRFANGWEVGAFFTLTDVPFDEFGEGSFDKGIRLTIPFNWALPDENRSKFSTVIRPLSRDGGARLNVDNRLWPIVRDADRKTLRETWETFWK